MRKLMWLAIGFTAACAAGVFLFDGFALPLAAFFCFLGAVGFCFVRNKSGKRICFSLFGCAAAFLLVWGYHTFYLRDAKSLDAQEAELTFTASDYSYETSYGIAVDGSIRWQDKTYQMKAYIPEGEPMSPGDRLSGVFHLRYTASGASREPTYHQGKGIFLLGYCRVVSKLERAQEDDPMDIPAHLRRDILKIIDSVFPEDTAAVAKALLLGIKNDLDYATDRAFQTSGISHIVAVSGMHVAILFSVLYPLCAKRRFLVALIGIPVLFLFAAVAGFTPSVLRACIMQSLMIIALLTGREYDPPTALSFAVLVLLCINPMTITSVSFQLSVACMAGIFLLNGPIINYLMDKKRLGRFKEKSRKAKFCKLIAGSVAMTLSANVFTLPLCAIHFGMISIVGVFTNLLVIWVVSFVFVGIIAACLLGALWIPLGSVVAWVVSWPLRYILSVSAFLGSLPVAAVYTQSIYIVLWIILSYGFVAVFAVFCRKHLRTAVMASGVILVLALAFSWLEPRLDTTRVSVIDVGQGQCILLQSAGEYYLVDCGSEDGQTADTVVNFLMSQGIFRLDGVILTHYDADHANALPDLLTQISVEQLILPDTNDDGNFRQVLEENWQDIIYWVDEDSRVFLDQGSITLYVAENPSNDNESSMCALFQSGNYDILITGDRSISGERDLLEKADLPRLELLIAGHHGANNATGRELLVRTMPKAVAISCGENRYGHPSQGLLKRLADCGCSVYRTDQTGTIIFRG